MIFRLGERRQSETSAITMRPGWLAQAAFVFLSLPSPIRGYPILPRTLRKGGIPRSRPRWDLASQSNLLVHRLCQRSRTADKVAAAVVSRRNIVRARGQRRGWELFHASAPSHRFQGCRAIVKDHWGGP